MHHPRSAARIVAGGALDRKHEPVHLAFPPHEPSRIRPIGVLRVVRQAAEQFVDVAWFAHVVRVSSEDGAIVS